MQQTLLILTIALVTSGFVTMSEAHAQYGYGGYGYGHASTAAEGAARGMADVVRSAGAANLMNSEAVKNLEDAKKKEIENRVLWVQSYFEMEKINRETRYADIAKRRATTEDLVRYAKDVEPRKLSTGELDPLTGEINWPVVLELDPYVDFRNKVEVLFAKWAKYGHLAANEQLELRKLMEGMKTALRERASEYPTNDYIYAKKFLESLLAETRQRPG